MVCCSSPAPMLSHLHMTDTYTSSHDRHLDILNPLHMTDSPRKLHIRMRFITTRHLHVSRCEINMSSLFYTQMPVGVESHAHAAHMHMLHTCTCYTHAHAAHSKELCDNKTSCHNPLSKVYTQRHIETHRDMCLWMCDRDVLYRQTSCTDGHFLESNHTCVSGCRIKSYRHLVESCLFSSCLVSSCLISSSLVS